MKYKFDDFLPSPPQALEPLAATEREMLEKQIGDLSRQVETYRREINTASYSDWFNRHISQLADEAAKNLAESSRKHLDAVIREQFQVVVEKAVAELFEQKAGEAVEKAVAAIFEREAGNFAQQIYQAIVSRIQPYALKSQR